MPIYAYRCASCGAEKDVLQKFSEAPLTVCPACAAESFHRVLTAPAFQLKGSGWYVTDFRDGNKPKSSGAGESGAAEGGKEGVKADAKADAKESKPDAKPAEAGAAAKPAGASAPKAGEPSAAGGA